MKQVVKLNAVSKEYYRGGVPFMAVDNVSLDITSGDYVNISSVDYDRDIIGL